MITSSSGRQPPEAASASDRDHIYIATTQCAADSYSYRLGRGQQSSITNKFDYMYIILIKQSKISTFISSGNALFLDSYIKITLLMRNIV